MNSKNRTVLSSTKFEGLALTDLKKLSCELKQEWTDKMVILLFGPIGVGKTQIVKFFLEDQFTNQYSDQSAHKFSNQSICSPTFSLHNHYEFCDKAIDHIDLYRLDTEDELMSSGFWDVFSQQFGIIIIEWADKLNENDIPVDWPIWKIYMQFNFKNNLLRDIAIKKC